MKVVYLLRVKDPIFFSIERVFSIVQTALQQVIQTETVHVIRTGVKFKNLLFLRRYVKSQQKDTIYHVTGDIHYTVFAFPRTNTILTIHDCVFLEQHKGFKRLILKKIFLDWPVRYIPTITAISEKTKNDIIQFTGCDPQKIRVIRNPLSPKIFFKKKEFNAAMPQLLFLGSTPNKNLDRVILALSDFSCFLAIIGKPTKEQIEQLKEKHVQFVIETGLTDEELADRYCNADIILFPTLYEGFGLPVIEGFKAGRAVLTSNLEPMKGISENAAWLVDPYDPDSIRQGLVDIIGDERVREQKIKAGLVIAKKYDPDYIANQYLNLYREIHKKICVE